MSRLSADSAAHIQRELRKHGATTEQANSYVNLVRLFEQQSRGEGELHHILPTNCGWWKKFSSCSWNITQVRWGHHIALHAALFDIFPDNDRLLSALRATTMRRSCLMMRLEKQSLAIHVYYFVGEHSLRDTAKKFETTTHGLDDFFVFKGWKKRTAGQQRAVFARYSLRKRANEIQDYYFDGGHGFSETVKHFHVAANTLVALFKEKRWKIRTPVEQRAIENLVRLEAKKADIYQRYFEEGRSWAQICRQFNCRSTPTGVMANLFAKLGWKRRTVAEQRAQSSMLRLRNQVSKVYRYYFVERLTFRDISGKLRTSPKFLAQLFQEQGWLSRTAYQQWAIGNEWRLNKAA